MAAGDSYRRKYLSFHKEAQEYDPRARAVMVEPFRLLWRSKSGANSTDASISRRPPISAEIRARVVRGTPPICRRFCRIQNIDRHSCLIAALGMAILTRGSSSRLDSGSGASRRRQQRPARRRCGRAAVHRRTGEPGCSSPERRVEQRLPPRVTAVGLGSSPASCSAVRRNGETGTPQSGGVCASPHMIAACLQQAVGRSQLNVLCVVGVGLEPVDLVRILEG
jgi:hypothetical protein